MVCSNDVDGPVASKDEKAWCCWGLFTPRLIVALFSANCMIRLRIFEKDSSKRSSCIGSTTGEHHHSSISRESHIAYR